jgi:uncharacterized protein involved in exopolysaccharide biosynthesis
MGGKRRPRRIAVDVIAEESTGMSPVQPSTKQEYPESQVWQAVLAFVLRERRAIAVGAAVGVLLATLLAHLSRPVYMVDLTVTPTSSSSSGAMRSLGSLSNLIGIANPLSQASDSFDYYIDGLTSRVAAERLVRDQNLMHKIFFTEWSEETRSWHPASSIPGIVLHNVAAVAGVPVRPWAPPDAARLQTFIKKNIVIDSDKKTRVTTISMASPNPQLAALLLLDLHKAVDGYLRERTLQRATQYIQYVNDELTRVTVAEYRLALVETASEQEKLRMAASSSLPFVAEPFGGPVIEPKPISPNVPQGWCIGAILGAILGALFAKFKNAPVIRNLRQWIATSLLAKPVVDFGRKMFHKSS